MLGCCIDGVLLHNLVDTTLHSYTDKIKQIKETLTWKQASGSLLWETKHELKFKVMTVSCYSNKACRTFSRVWRDKNKQRKTIKLKTYLWHPATSSACRKIPFSLWILQFVMTIASLRLDERDPTPPGLWRQPLWWVASEAIRPGDLPQAFYLRHLRVRL